MMMLERLVMLVALIILVVIALIILVVLTITMLESTKDRGNMINQLESATR